MNRNYPIGPFVTPETLSFEQIQKHLVGLASFPDRLEAMVRALPAEALDKAYREGGWTGRQVIHHVADSHMNALVRMKLCLTEAHPTVKPYDENLWAQGADYSASVTPALLMIRGIHERMHAMLSACKEADFERLYFHPENRHSRSLGFLCAMYDWHGSHHLAHLEILRGGN